MAKVIFGNTMFGKAPFTSHCWNKDQSMLAISTEFGKVNLYNVNGDQLTLAHTLNEHTGRVTGIDWCYETNQIATCSADRNAFVWILENGEWRPTLVLLRVNRAATCIHFSPKGNKFAVGTGSRLIAVCYFDVANNFWVSKHIKKPIKSTVTCLDWHPNNLLLVAGGTDFKVRVFSALVNEIEPKTSEETSWGAMKSFGTMMAECDAEGWVHSVAFNNDGSKAVAVSHGCVVTVFSASSSVNTILEMFPFKTVCWLTDKRIVCAGFDFKPEIFDVTDNGTIVHAGCIDKMTKEASTGQVKAKDLFKSRDNRGGGEGGESADAGDMSIMSVHKNTITDIRVYSGTSKTSVSKISTCGLDGQIVIWDLDALSSQLKQ